MSRTNPRKEQGATERRDIITGITVAGFKSIRDERHVEVGPLTVLAGPNSAGKSSIIQPLLLMKQTLESTYKPAGALELAGPHVKFTSADQLLSRTGKESRLRSFRVGIEVDHRSSVTFFFAKQAKTKGGFSVTRNTIVMNGTHVTLRPKMASTEIERAAPSKLIAERDSILHLPDEWHRWTIEQERFFLRVGLARGTKVREASGSRSMIVSQVLHPPVRAATLRIRDLLHVSSLRGNPDRSYPLAAVGKRYPGKFENYVASLLEYWQENDLRKLQQVGSDLWSLALTSEVQTRRIDDSTIEVRVARLEGRRRNTSRDFVSIADVGCGVSQALPVVVALAAAEAGQIVYIEQPENDLHPRAESIMARLLYQAVKRGVRVVVETHSSLLLLAIQTLVAEGNLDSRLVRLHWFNLNHEGITEVTSAGLDESGAFGDWPEDFGEVELKAESSYLDAAERHLLGH